MIAKGPLVFVWILFVHISGIYLFSRGFLLTRLALPDFAQCDTASCTDLATHKRAVMLIIDALRFDAISDDPPKPHSPYHHNILTLPRELTARHPERSFIFQAYADPPTTTMQRVKGLTTGSLPTFIDMGSNFGGYSVTEDSILRQLQLVDKKIGIVGDNTWVTLFPDTFQPNVTFAFPSFNVEDLDTVDQGVTQHLLPLLEDQSHSWDFIIAHGLGVDHVGHRVGPDHPKMKAKLEQMNDLLTSVVERIPEDTLLIVLGDHGMDRAGNHGGDSILETLSALWIYSKGPALSQRQFRIHNDLLPTSPFPGAAQSHRIVQQIDIVPSLSLLLGLPIPFNNLGTVIPELFDRDTSGSIVTQAMTMNAHQIRGYLDRYRFSPAGKDLEIAWPSLLTAWASIEAVTSVENRLNALFEFNRLALSSCRSLWAQFNTILMGSGLLVIAMSIVSSWVLYVGLNVNNPDQWLGRKLKMIFGGMVGGAITGSLVYIVLHDRADGMTIYLAGALGSALVSSFLVVFDAFGHFSVKSFTPVSVLMILHTLSFSSNSFTIWEDKIVLFILLSSIIPSVFVGLSAPTPRLRNRILGYSSLFAICVRLMALSTVCREEQAPHCTVTFYTSSTSSAPPTIALILATPVSLLLPQLIKHVLGISKSDKGLAAIFLPYVFTPSVLAGTLFWTMEWIQSVDVLGDQWSDILRTLRTVSARSSMLGLFLGGLVLWWSIPVCLEVSTGTQDDVPATENGSSTSQKKQMTVIGFANAYGSPYLMFALVFLGSGWMTEQLAAQVTLGLAVVAVLAHLEVVDSVRDVKSLNAAFAAGTPSAALNLAAVRVPLSFSDILPLALLAMHSFYSTGHQSTISSLQWKSGFILTANAKTPYSQMTVVINTFIPHVFIALTSPLLALWNLAPLPPPPALLLALRAVLGFSTYYAVLLFGSATSAMLLRRHLMVWKIFAPKYMTAAATLVAVDVGILLGVLIGLTRVEGRMTKLFRALA